MTRAGLRAGDEITALDGREVPGRSDVVLGLVDAMSGDGRVELVVRGGDGASRRVAIAVGTPTWRALTEPTAFSRGFGFPLLGAAAPGRDRPRGRGGPRRAPDRTGGRVIAVGGRVPVAGLPGAGRGHPAAGPRDLVEYERGGVRQRTRGSRPMPTRSVAASVGTHPRRRPAAGRCPADMIVNREFGPLEALAYVGAALLGHDGPPGAHVLADDRRPGVDEEPLRADLDRRSTPAIQARRRAAFLGFRC